MPDRRVASRYARALFQAALRSGRIARVEEDLAALVEALRRSPRARTFLESPEQSREDKRVVLQRVLGERADPLLLRLIDLLLEKRRETLLDEVYAEYVALRRDHDGILHVKVTSARPLDESERSAVVEKLRVRTGKTIEATFDIDPTLMGGLRVQFGDYVLDGTVRGALARLRERLVYDFLKQS